MRCFELNPNCSLSLPAAAAFFGSVAVAPVFIALVFAVQGYWPVLPFVGLQVLGLGWALWATFRRSRQREYVLLDERRVVVEKYPCKRPERMEFPRHWVRVRTQRSPYRHEPSQLLLECQGRCCEIGSFLTEDERLRLGRRLSELLRA